MDHKDIETNQASCIGDADDILDQSVRCLCGAVKFRVQGRIIFNELCHCRACSWAASVTPVHLIGVTDPEVTYASTPDKVKVLPGMGGMEHGRCVECMVQVFQKPKDASMVALFPTTFHIGGEGSIEQILPPKYWPKCHSNYENRAMNVEDSLPKYKTFPPNDQMHNDGTLV